MANIISFTKLKQQYRGTYDSDKADIFYCHTESGVAEFSRTKEGLYTVSLSNEYKNAVKENDEPVPELIGESLVNTVAENMSHHSAAEVKRVKVARKLYHVIGTSPPPKFKTILRSNQISDCLVVENNVDLAHDIFGKDIPTLKSKDTRRTPKPIIIDSIKVPPELV